MAFLQMSEPVIVCAFCGKRFKDRGKFLDHLLKHHRTQRAMVKSIADCYHKE